MCVGSPLPSLECGYANGYDGCLRLNLMCCFRLNLVFCFRLNDYYDGYADFLLLSNCYGGYTDPHAG